MTVSPSVVAPQNGPTTSPVARWRDYVALTKPRIIELLLVTTVPVMFAAAGGPVALTTLLATVLGGALAAAGANALNCALDHDIDAHMARTAHRATATGAVSPQRAAVFGGVLALASFIVLVVTVNGLSALLAAVAVISYVGGYTMLLKRRTPSNIVWGGVAGCFPVLIGWAAVANEVSWAALALFLVVFFWTPPHYWPLSINYREDYANAGVPMLGVVADPGFVCARIINYTWATVSCSIAYGVLANAGRVYAVVAVVSAAWFLWEAYRMQRTSESAQGAMRLFHVSISYLTVLFLAVGVDAFVR